MLRLPKFRYLQPTSLVEAVRMMSDSGPEATFVAGGTDLYPNMKRRQQTPKVVIGLAQLDELRTTTGKPAAIASTTVKENGSGSSVVYSSASWRRYTAGRSFTKLEVFKNSTGS